MRISYYPAKSKLEKVYSNPDAFVKLPLPLYTDPEPRDPLEEP